MSKSNVTALRMNGEELYERILQAFSEKARTLGLRSIVMAELAAELGISTKTVYQHFPTKAALVRALVDRWGSDLPSREKVQEIVDSSPVDALKLWAERWSEREARFSQAFWTDLARDYPDAFAALEQQRKKFGAHGRSMLQPYVRKELSGQLVEDFFRLLVRHASDPQVCEALQLTRREAVTMAVDLWARGALTRSAIDRASDEGGNQEERNKG